MNLNKKVPDIIKIASRDLRINQTKAEVLLWNRLKGDKVGFRFLRQKPIYVYTENSGLDRFVIPDFYCNEKKLILEIDGNVHNLKEVLILDKEKENLLNNKGINVFRIKNEEIYDNIENVILKIKQKLI